MNDKTKDRMLNEALQFMTIFQMQALDAHTCRNIISLIKKKHFGDFVIAQN